MFCLVVALLSLVITQMTWMLYAYAGNTDKTLDWVEKGYIRKDPDNAYLGVTPILKPYHNELRFIEIIQRLNLPLGEFQ